jgi:hypothetical protein
LPGGRAAVTGVAETLGISAGVVRQLEDVFHAHQELTERRIELVVPDGTPF